MEASEPDIAGDEIETGHEEGFPTGHDSWVLGIAGTVSSYLVGVRQAVFCPCAGRALGNCRWRCCRSRSHSHEEPRSPNQLVFVHRGDYSTMGKSCLVAHGLCRLEAFGD